MEIRPTDIGLKRERKAKAKRLRMDTVMEMVFKTKDKKLSLI
jgi:hypothetical protein